MKATTLLLAVLVAVVVADSPYAESQPIVEAPAKGKTVDPNPRPMPQERDHTDYVNQGIIDAPARGLTEREQLADLMKQQHKALLEEKAKEASMAPSIAPPADAPPAGTGHADDQNEDPIKQETKQVLPSHKPDKKKESNGGSPVIGPPAGHRKTGDMLLEADESIDNIQQLFADDVPSKNAVASSGLPQIDAPSDDAEEIKQNAIVKDEKAKLRGAPKPWAPRKVHSDLPQIDVPGNVGKTVTKAATRIAAAKKVVDEHPYQAWAKRAEAARERAEGAYSFDVDAPGDIAEPAQAKAVPSQPRRKAEDPNKWTHNVSDMVERSSDEILPTAAISDPLQEAPEPKAKPAPAKPSRNWAHNVDDDTNINTGLPMIDGPANIAEVRTSPVNVAPKSVYLGEPSPPKIPAPTRDWDDME